MDRQRESRREFFVKVARLGSAAGLSGMVGDSVLTSLAETATAITLSNDKISVTIDAARGTLAGLHNKLTDERHTIHSVEFAIVSDQGTVSSGQMQVRGVRHGPERVEVDLRGEHFTAQVHYQLGEAWVEKWVTFTSNKPLTLKRMVMGQRTYSPAFREIHAHTDNTIFDVPINWFLRTEKGGCFTGMEFPFTVGDRAVDSMTLTYGGWRTRYDAPLSSFSDIMGHPLPTRLEDMNVRLQAGENYTSEREFLGVYRRTGMYRDKSLTGIPRILTTTPERLDWGEVWAMQAFMRYVLPPLPTTHQGFELYMNGWWAGLPQDPIGPKDVAVYKQSIDQCKQLGIGMFGYADFWLGMARFIDRSGEFVKTVGKDQQLPLSPEAQSVLDYAEKSKMGVCGASEGLSHFREDRPDWKLINQDGSKPGILCWANTPSTDWYFELLNNVLTRYQGVQLWIWDGGWMPGDPEVSMAWDCSAKNHTHAPGNIGYPEYLNVMSVLRRLRERHPRVELGVCWAVKCAGPWAQRYLDVHENYYENQGPDDLRFQMWYNQNSSFLPCERNMSQMWFEFTPSQMKLPQKTRDYWKIWFTPGTRDYRYGMMSALSAGVNLVFMVQLPTFHSEEEKQQYVAFVGKWRRWASDNLACLMVKRDIFGQPLRKDGIDGNARILNDRGFIFVFNPTQTRHIGRIALDERIHLHAGKVWEAKVIFPEDAGTLGTYAHGQQLLVDMPAGTCKLVEIVPHAGPGIPPVVPVGADVQDAF